MILALLPPLCCLLITLNFRGAGSSWRFSFLAAAVAVGLLLTAATELLSAFGQINFLALLLFWGSASAGCAVLLVSTANRFGARQLMSMRARLNWMLASVIAIAAVTAAVAALSAPNNFDSMTYHLSRVMHWIQNQSVAHYPTNIPRQIELNPWAEFALLHLQILSGGDYFANFVQWFAMVGSVIGVTAIAMALGADLRAQSCAAVVAATLPMGILQASSTQNDYVVAFWLVCFVYFGLLAKKRHFWLCLLAAASSLGLAILTKATAYLYAAPFLAWFFVSTFASCRRRALWSVPLVAALVLAINAGHYARNVETFGSPLSSDNTPYVNEAFNGTSLFSNVSRNIALHVGTRSGRVNEAIQAGYEGLFEFLRLDINDPKTTWENTSFSVLHARRHEDVAGNLLHFLLIALVVAVLAARRDMRAIPGVLPYVFSVSAGFLLFCLYLKWQPWHSRLHLPLFVLWSPVIAMVLTRHSREWVARTAMIVLLALSLPSLFTNETRRLLGKDSIVLTSRMHQYFRNQPELEKPYHDAALLVAASGCRDVGLRLHDLEYPLWVLLKDMSGGDVRVEHVGVANASASLWRRDFTPCATIRTSNDMLPHVSLSPAPGLR